jgi:hypothetical protein
MRKAFLLLLFFATLTASTQKNKIPISSDETQLKNPGFELKKSKNEKNYLFINGLLNCIHRISAEE